LYISVPDTDIVIILLICMYHLKLSTVIFQKAFKEERQFLEQSRPFQAEVFWVVTHCSAVVGDQHFRGPYCPHLQITWRWKHWYPTATLCGVTTQKNLTWIFTVVKTSNLELFPIVA